MADTDADGIDDAMEATLRVALTAAARVGERVARQREQEARDAQAASEQEAREFQARLHSERSAARAALAPVHRAEWWERAEPADVARAWETAVAWRSLDVDAQRAADHIRDQVRGRYGLDVDDLGADEGAVRAALERRGVEAEPVGEGERARDQREWGEAVGVWVDDAEPQEEVSPDGGDLEPVGVEASYDSAQRREELAASVARSADRETVDARVVADTHQARPAQEAVAAAPGRAARAKRSRGAPGRAQERTRGR